MLYSIRGRPPGAVLMNTIDVFPRSWGTFVLQGNTSSYLKSQQQAGNTVLPEAPIYYSPSGQSYAWATLNCRKRVLPRRLAASRFLADQRLTAVPDVRQITIYFTLIFLFQGTAPLLRGPEGVYRVWLVGYHHYQPDSTVTVRAWLTPAGGRDLDQKEQTRQTG